MARTPRSQPFLPLLAALAVIPSAGAQTSIEATVSFDHSPTAALMTMEVEDHANGYWMLQYSTDLATWHDFRPFKVNNGHYHLDLEVIEGLPMAFFRGAFDPTGQSGPNRVADATVLPAVAENYADPSLPAHFFAPPILAQDNTPPDNIVTDPGATLGRVLFYDQRLSANNRVSCASCHQQEHGFSDPRQFSVGFEGGLTGRNSMGLTNAKYYQRAHFFWDERAATLEEQVLLPIQNEVEMGLTLPELVAKVSAEEFYRELFTEAFGDDTVTTDRISRALAQFVRSIISTETKYDAGRPVGFVNLTPLENQGRQLFNGQAGCARCHGTDNFVPNNVFNNGLENPYTDQGIGAITGNPRDNGKFKVPSLRNSALTAPYMHDGRFATLKEVIEFYNSQVVDHPNLAPQLRNPGGPPRPGQPPRPGGPRRLNLTEGQKDALAAFLHTLTDPTLATDPKFSDPFDYGDHD